MKSERPIMAWLRQTRRMLPDAAGAENDIELRYKPLINIVLGGSHGYSVSLLYARTETKSDMKHRHGSSERTGKEVEACGHAEMDFLK